MFTIYHGRIKVENVLCLRMPSMHRGYAELLRYIIIIPTKYEAWKKSYITISVLIRTVYSSKSSITNFVNVLTS